MTRTRRWQIWIDTGGTFTDCLAVAPDESLHRVKVLSNSTLRASVREQIDDHSIILDHAWFAPDGFIAGMRLHRLGGAVEDAALIEGFQAARSLVRLDREVGGMKPGDAIVIRSDEPAPLLAARLVTRTPHRDELPPIDMRLATTRATNALLERRIEPVAFFVTKGFRDLLLIGDQTRPDLFALRIVKPPPLFARVVEVDERLSSTGDVMREIDESSVRQEAARLAAAGVRSAAVALLHSYLNPQHEHRIRDLLRREGFTHVSCSSDLAPLIRILPRAETAVVNAAVAPVIEDYIDEIRGRLRGGSLRLMTSAGGLAAGESVRAKDTLLSGPAGGVVGAAASGRRAGFSKIIGFDMGGTSTDVCRYDGDFRLFRGVQGFDYRFEHHVGDARIMAPALAIETVAAGGGSICAWRHGRLHVGPQSAGADPGPACYGGGGPFTLTDVNLLLDRLDPARFEIPLDRAAAGRAFDGLIRSMEAEGADVRDCDAILEGLLAIADERMADAIAQVSLRRGFDPTEYAMVSFGGAGGQHACRVADHLGIRTIIMPRDASLLSALGLGHAAIERVAQRQVLTALDELGDDLERIIEDAEAEAVAALERDDADAAGRAACRVIVHARLLGQESSIALDARRRVEIDSAFRDAYGRLYGHAPEGRPIEVESVRIIATLPSGVAVEPNEPVKPHEPSPCARVPVFVGGRRQAAPRFERSQLEPGGTIGGPALIVDRSSTYIIESGWRAAVDGGRAIVLERIEDDEPRRSTRHRSDIVERNLFMHRFSAIAVEMGEQLQRTALSTNVKERRDFSCALLDQNGRLLVNAPHIPVHLGALGLCVRRVAEAMEMREGDVIVTNHPAFGGSHLPDITVITPIFDGEGRMLGYAANRAHHAEIGGSRPGSMPPRATSLHEEGVVIPPMHLVRAGRSCIADVERRLSVPPFPSRAIAENLADLRAAIAANRRGVDAMRALADRFGPDEIRAHIEAIQLRASDLAERAIRQLSPGTRSAEETLDDGSVIRVAMTIDDGRINIDFAGTSPQHSGNLNATPAVVHSAVIYVLRTLIGESLPLNEGIMRRVTIDIPRSMLNPVFGDEPRNWPAVVGGNTETSQRIVDALIKALGLCAGSQGTMNNVLFGNDRFGYYETVCGGTGAGPDFHGASAVHCHMTNTRLTDAEVLEHRYPVRLRRFEIRPGSGGRGRFDGGDGVVRELEFLEPLQLSVLTQRRAAGPSGHAGGGDGLPGRQSIHAAKGGVTELGSIDGVDVEPGDIFILETPGGGGFGTPERRNVGK